jgi:regulator of PEP synthase PpsR (kinase-PPPase family)
MIHLISDSTGETVRAMAEACLAQFNQQGAASALPKMRLWRLVRSPERAAEVMAQIVAEIAQSANPNTAPLIVYSIVIPAVQMVVETEAALANIPVHHALSPLTNFLGRYLELRARVPSAGKQHALTDAYFSRVAAMEFALKHDDGMAQDSLHQADVVLVGVSRTAKSPTCLYLAHHGIKAANVPIVTGIAPPSVLLAPTSPPVVALSQDIAQLIAVRRKRLGFLGRGEASLDNYVDPTLVREEVVAALKLYQQQGWPVINTSQKSVEEVAAEVQELLAKSVVAKPEEGTKS